MLNISINRTTTPKEKPDFSKMEYMDIVSYLGKETQAVLNYLYGMNAKNPEFLKQFENKTAGVGVNKNTPAENEIQALTGATITSSAVTSAVNAALENYANVTGGADNG